MKSAASLIALASTLVCGSNASAQDQALTLETTFEGSVSDAVASELREALHAGLTATALRPVLTEQATRERLGAGADRLMVCAGEAACLIEVGEVGRCDRAVVAAVSVAGEIYSYVVDVYDLSSGEAVYSGDSDCPLCTVDEAVDELRTLAETAGTALPAVEAPEVATAEPAREVVLEPAPPALEPMSREVTVSVRVEPTTAVLTWDGAPVGTGTADVTVAPGSYLLRAEAPGYQGAERRIEVAEGHGDTLVNLQLEPIAAAGTVYRTDGTFDETNTTAIGSVLAGAGLASLITGIVLLAIDGDTTCSEGPIDQCAKVYDTTAGGTILTILGSSAITAGVTLLLWDVLAGDPHRADEPRSTRLDVAGGDGGAVLVFEGRF